MKENQMVKSYLRPLVCNCLTLKKIVLKTKPKKNNWICLHFNKTFFSLSLFLVFKILLSLLKIFLTFFNSPILENYKRSCLRNSGLGGVGLGCQLDLLTKLLTYLLFLRQNLTTFCAKKIARTEMQARATQCNTTANCNNNNNNNNNILKII